MVPEEVALPPVYGTAVMPAETSSTFGEDNSMSYSTQIDPVDPLAGPVEVTCIPKATES